VGHNTTLVAPITGKFRLAGYDWVRGLAPMKEGRDWVIVGTRSARKTLKGALPYDQ
jgi:hypothetical protein